jgi:hypothetical protein
MTSISYLWSYIDAFYSVHPWLHVIAALAAAILLFEGMWKTQMAGSPEWWSDE